MKTLRALNAALRQRGIKERLVRNSAGGGYYYFVDGDSASWRRASVYVFHFSQLSVDEWVDEHKQMQESA